MKYLPELLFLCVIKSIYTNSAETSKKGDNIEVNQLNGKYTKSAEKPKKVDNIEVDQLIGKILHADKFNELVDIIADRAIIKLNDFQKSTKTVKGVVYRSLISSTDNDDSIVEPKRPKKHKHGKINVDAVLKKKVVSLDNLKLRYKNLKNLHYNTHLKDHNNDSLASLSAENKDFSKVAQDIKLDFDENIKTRSDENFNNPVGDTTDENQNMTSTTIRLEGDKAFAWVESPDYKEYHEQLAKIKDILLTK